MMSKNLISKENLEDSGLLREYVTLNFLHEYLLTIPQIRIVRSKDPNSKKPHRGYAFIVYEREKDMKGTDIIHSSPSPFDDLHMKMKEKKKASEDEHAYFDHFYFIPLPIYESVHSMKIYHGKVYP